MTHNCRCFNATPPLAPCQHSSRFASCRHCSFGTAAGSALICWTASPSPGTTRRSVRRSPATTTRSPARRRSPRAAVPRHGLTGADRRGRLLSRGCVQQYLEAAGDSGCLRIHPGDPSTPATNRLRAFHPARVSRVHKAAGDSGCLRIHPGDPSTPATNRLRAFRPARVSRVHKAPATLDACASTRETQVLPQLIGCAPFAQPV